MSIEQPPTYWFPNINFNPSFYEIPTGSGLSQAQANTLYLRKTVPDTAIAVETFNAGINANALSTFNADVNIVGTGNDLVITNSQTIPTKTITLSTSGVDPTITILDTTNSLDLSPTGIEPVSGTPLTLNIATLTNIDLNVGTGARTGTGTVGNPYVIHNYSDGDNCLEGNGVHLNNGTNNQSNTNIHNGASSSGNVNIMNGASSSGNINIMTGASSTGGINIGTGTNGSITLGNTNGFVKLTAPTTVSVTPADNSSDLNVPNTAWVLSRPHTFSASQSFTSQASFSGALYGILCSRIGGLVGQTTQTLFNNTANSTITIGSTSEVTVDNTLKCNIIAGTANNSTMEIGKGITTGVVKIGDDLTTTGLQMGTSQTSGGISIGQQTGRTGDINVGTVMAAGAINIGSEMTGGSVNIGSTSVNTNIGKLVTDTINPTNPSSIINNISLANTTAGNVYIASSAVLGSTNYTVLGTSGVSDTYIRGRGINIADGGGGVNIGSNGATPTNIVMNATNIKQVVPMVGGGTCETVIGNATNATSMSTTFNKKSQTGSSTAINCYTMVVPNIYSCGYFEIIVCGSNQHVGGYCYKANFSIFGFTPSDVNVLYTAGNDVNLYFNVVGSIITLSVATGTAGESPNQCFVTTLIAYPTITISDTYFDYSVTAV